MPIYEYVCGACGNAHEALQKISDAPLTDCPACGATSLKKKVSAPAFRLAGSGWYETDFKTGAKRISQMTRVVDPIRVARVRHPVRLARQVARQTRTPGSKSENEHANTLLRCN